MTEEDYFYTLHQYYLQYNVKKQFEIYKSAIYELDMVEPELVIYEKDFNTVCIATKKDFIRERLDDRFNIRLITTISNEEKMEELIFILSNYEDYEELLLNIISVLDGSMKLGFTISDK